MPNSIYGRQFNLFGSLPFGYNPYSQSSVTNTGGGFWGDENTVWNLADPSGLVQSLPETQSVLRGLHLQYNNNFASQIQSPANFYDNMLAQQALSTYSYQGTSSPTDMMSNMFSMMLLMKKFDSLNKPKDKDEKTVNAKDANIKEMIDDDNVDDDTEFKYTNLDNYSKDKFKELKGTDGKPVKFKDALKSVGIEISSLSENAEKVIAQSLGYPNSNNFENLEIRGDAQYKTLLEQIGFSADSTSITKKELIENIDKLKSGETLQQIKENERAQKSKIDALKNHLKSSATFDADGIKTSIDNLISDKKGTQKLFDKIKNGDIQLTQIFKALAKNDPANPDRDIDDSIEDFGEILTKLKDAAEEHDLTDSWNTILDNIKDEDKNAMYDKVPKPGWLSSEFNKHAYNKRKEEIDKTITDAVAEKEQPAEEPATPESNPEAN